MFSLLQERAKVHWGSWITLGNLHKSNTERVNKKSMTSHLICVEVLIKTTKDTIKKSLPSTNFCKLAKLTKRTEDPEGRAKHLLRTHPSIHAAETEQIAKGEEQGLTPTVSAMHHAVLNVMEMTEGVWTLTHSTALTPLTHL